MNIPRKANNDWIALFELDFSAHTFSDKTHCEDVRYWIKRSGNTQIHEASSTGNRYEMRNYEVFDKKGVKVNIEWFNWTCLSITETYRDYYGCGLRVEIGDPSGVIKSVSISTLIGHNHLKEHLLISCIMYFLLSLKSSNSWEEALSYENNLSKFEINNMGMLLIKPPIKDMIYTRFSTYDYKWD